MSPTLADLEREAAQESSRRRAKVKYALNLMFPFAALASASLLLYLGNPWGLWVLAAGLSREGFLLARAQALEFPGGVLPWVLGLAAAFWTSLWSFGPPRGGPEARAVAEALLYCRPEAPGHAPSFLYMALASALPRVWGPVSLPLLSSLLAALAFLLVFTLIRLMGLRPGLALAGAGTLMLAAGVQPGSEWSARADVLPCLVGGVFVLSLFKVGSGPSASSGLAGLLWFFLLLESPWTALLILPALFTLALARPRLGSWASALRGLPPALALLLVLPWARGLGRAVPGWGYDMEGILSQLGSPWLRGWKASLHWSSLFSLPVSSCGVLALGLAFLSPLFCRGWKGLTHALLYSQLALGLALSILIPPLAPACRPFLILAFPLAALALDGAWDRSQDWNLRARVGARMSLTALLALALAFQLRASLRAREAGDGGSLLEIGRRIWTEAGPGGIILAGDPRLTATLEYLDLFEGATLPKDREILRFADLGERDYLRAVIHKRPEILFSEFLDGNPAGVAQGLAAAMPERRLILVGEGPRKAFKGYNAVPRILCERLEIADHKVSTPDPAGALEDLGLIRGSPAAVFISEGFLRLGRFYLSQKKANQAFTAASRALDLDPGSSAARSLRQDVYESSGHLEQARQGYEEILRRTPGDIQAHLDLARLLLKKNAADEAALHFQDVLKLNRREAEAYLGLGRIQAAKGENGAALASLEKGLSLEPEDDEARLILARLYLSLDNSRGAEEHLRYLLEKKPDDRKIQELLGKALASRDRP